MSACAERGRARVAAVHRLHGEEAALDRLRSETAQAAAGEAAVLSNLRGQIGELQNILNVSRARSRGQRCSPQCTAGESATRMGRTVPRTRA
jgi:hypothetical protein